MSGDASKARPSATRLFSPPDRCLGARSSSVLQPQQRDDTGDLICAGAPGAAPPAEQKIFLHVHMREQARVLEHQTGAALLRRHEDTRLGVQHSAAVQHDAALGRARQSRQRVHDAALA